MDIEARSKAKRDQISGKVSPCTKHSTDYRYLHLKTKRQRTESSEGLLATNKRVM